MQLIDLLHQPVDVLMVSMHSRLIVFNVILNAPNVIALGVLLVPLEDPMHLPVTVQPILMIMELIFAWVVLLNVMDVH